MPAMATDPTHMVQCVIGILSFSAAHAAHILFAAHGVNHRSRTEEEQGLEKCVREQMEHRHPVSAHAQRQKHVT